MGQVTHCMEDISRQIAFAGQFLKFGKFTFQVADLGPALHSEIYQRTDQKITFGTEALLTFVGYPLVAEDLKDLPDLLQNLPAQAPALLALVKAFLEFHLCSVEHVSLAVKRA